MNINAKYWINHLKLQSHPEGGFYSETYKSRKYQFRNETFNTKHTATLIYFLLEEPDFSAFHKLKSDEVWIYQKGEALDIYIIDDSGKLKIERLGSDLENDEKLQVVIPANSWFAAELTHKNSYCLTSCLVTPGFEWDDFELGKRKLLTQLFPSHKQLFEKLCKE